MLDHILQDLNVFVDGFGKIGWCEKLETPKIKKKSEKFRGGGMLAERNHIVGYEPFEFKFSLNAFDPHLVRQCGLFSKNAITVSFVAAFDGDKNAKRAASLITRSKFGEIDPGAWEPGKKAMLQAHGFCDALKLVYDGETLYDIDIENQKYLIDGVDEYAWVRAALG